MNEEVGILVRVARGSYYRDKRTGTRHNGGEALRLPAQLAHRLCNPPDGSRATMRLVGPNEKVDDYLSPEQIMAKARQMMAEAKTLAQSARALDQVETVQQLQPIQENQK